MTRIDVQVHPPENRLGNIAPRKIDENAGRADDCTGERTQDDRREDVNAVEAIETSAFGVRLMLWRSATRSRALRERATAIGWSMR